MIQLIGFVGRMGSGKTTAAQYLVDKYHFERVAFADALKEKCARITPDGQINKVRDRELLQFIGTEYFRNKVDQDYWIKAYSEYVKSQLSRAVSIVTDDVRFGNEAATIKKLGGILIGISAPTEVRHDRLVERHGGPVEGISGHASEENVASLRYACDDHLVNDRDLDDLYAQIDRIYDWAANLQKAGAA